MSNENIGDKAVLLSPPTRLYVPKNTRRKTRTFSEYLWRKFVKIVFRNKNLWVDRFDILSSNIPRDVGGEIINICNARCTFCGYGKGEKGKAADYRVKGKLDRDVYTHTLKLFSESGGGVFSLSPILGEVSAHPDWLEMVKEAVSYPNIRGVSCFSNAILLDKFGSKEILTSGISALSISTALGSQEQYQRVYGVDKYEKVVSNIFDLLKTNNELGKPVDVSVLLRIDKPYDEFFNTEIYKELVQHIDPLKIEILDDFWDDFKGLIPREDLPKGQIFKTQQPDKTLPCYAMYRKLQVMLDGTMQPCSCRVEPELWGGNIKDYDSLEAAWQDPQIESLRQKWHGGEMPDCCKKCSHYQPYTNLARGYSPALVIPRVAKALWRRIKF